MTAEGSEGLTLDIVTLDRVVDVDRPYAPNHGPSWDPYIVTELTTDEDRRTSFRGEVNT